MRRIILIYMLFSISWMLHAQSHCSHAHIRKMGGGMMTDPSNLRSDTINIVSYDIHLDMTLMNSSYLQGHCSVVFTALMDNQDHLVLDLEGLQVDSVIADGNTLLFSQSNAQLYIPLSTTLDTGDSQTIQVFYRGNPIQDPSWGGFYYNSGYAFNLGVAFDSEPHNYGRVWHPCFDNFVEKASYTFHVLTNNGRTAYCNGLRTGVDIVGQDSLLTHWQMNEDIPSYLASVTVAPYVHAESSFENLEGNPIPIYLTAKAQDTTAMKISMQNLVPWIQYAETKFGPYKWPRVGYCAVPFSGGAMEHATNISYPLFAINGTLDYETLMAHELSHHWWGNLVTCRTAGDMWINEGLASYCEALFMEGIYGAEAYKKYVRDNFKEVLTRAHRNDGGYYALADIPSALTYGDHVYKKGALIAHNLRGQLGDSTFFSIIQSLMESYSYDNISTSELKAYWQSLTQQDVTTFFEDWIEQPGLPEFRIRQATSMGANQWQVQIEPHQHHSNQPHTQVWMQITAVNTEGTKWREDVLAGAVVTDHIITLPDGFIPMHFYLNEDERIHFAVLSEEKWITTPGAHDLDFAEMDIDVTSIGSNDSLWIRVENHFAAVDELQLTTGYHLSTDRWWNVMITSDLSETIAADIRYHGADNQTNYFDPTFFQEMFTNGFNEDSLVLMHRAEPGLPWIEAQGYNVVTTPSLTNGTGRIHIDNLQSGQYCWAFRDISNALQESLPAVNTFIQKGNIMHIQCATQYQGLEVFDSVGKRVLSTYIDKESAISMEAWPAGLYTFVLRGDQQQTHKAVIRK